MAVAVNTPSRGRFEPARELAFGSITNSFTMIGTTFGASFYVLFVQNFTDVTIDFSVSYVGSDVTFSLAAGGAMTSDMLSNNVIVSNGEAAWCKYRTGAPSSGFVQVSAIEPTNN